MTSLERALVARGFTLAEWEVRPEDGSLCSAAAQAGSIRLEPLLMALLVALCARAGKVVAKQHLLDTVWSGRYVSDETIKGSLYQLRKALGDDPRRPRFIETLPKRGYRMLVQPVLLPEPAPAPGEPGAFGPRELARELVRKGRAALAGPSDAPALKQAKLYFERALQTDPDDAEALSGLAHADILGVRVGLGRGRELFLRAREAAQRALEIDPERAEAQAALGVARFALDRDLAAAESAFHRALDLDPREPLARRWYARFLAARGRHAEAVTEARRALEAEPLSLPVRRDLIEVLFWARRYDEAVAEAHRLFDVAPHSPDIQLALVWIYLLRGAEREALEAFLAGMRMLEVAPERLERARQTFAEGGLPALLRLWVAVLEHGATFGQKAPDDLLILHALLGERDRCFALLEEALEDGNPALLWLPVSPLFDALRDDPRYAPFVARLGLPPAPPAP